MFRDYKNYDVLEDGHIWSKKHKKFLKPINRKNGYQQVNLVDNEGKRHQEYVHRVVFCAVNGLWEIPKEMQINHKSEEKQMNAIWNLELVSAKENCNFGTRNERIAKAQTNRQDQSKRVGAFKDDVLVMVFPSTAEAGRQGYNHGNVAACCRNCYIREGNNKYKGFEWRYLDEQ